MNELDNCYFLEKLPAEVRTEVYRHLPYKDILVMRTLCKQTKADIDKHLKFHVKIDQSFRGFRKLFRFRVRSCVIVHLKQHFRNLNLSAPVLMKKIVFDGSISSTNLFKLLSHYVTVEHLVFTHETLGIDNLFSSARIQTSLQSLSMLTHLNLQCLRYPLNDPLEPTVNVTAFLQATFPSLVSFKLYFSLWGNWLPLFMFLQRHVDTLKDLELQVGDRGDSRNTEIFLQTYPHANIRTQLNMETLKRLRLLEFRFRDDVLHLNPTSRNIFLNIINEQKSLKTFQFHSPGDISADNLKRIVRQNASTLGEIAIYNLKSLPQPQINNNAPLPPRIVVDMTMFRDCVNLKILALSCSSLNNPQEADVVEMKMTNLDVIPSSVERLHVNGFNFNGEDLIKLSRTTSNLKEILVVDAGFMVYSTILINILTNCKHLEYLYVRPVSSRVSGDENWYREVNILSVLYNRFMGTSYDPIDDLDGFEAFVTETDREWIRENLPLS